jgi:acyl carrier protein
MPAVATARAASAKAEFPHAEVQALIRKEVEDAEAESVVLHPGWQPVPDSLRMVTVIASIEKLLGIKLPPEKVVRKGGWKSGDDCVSDMTRKIQDIWNKRQQ